MADYYSQQSGGVPPPPPGPELSVRTMETDLKSMSQSGGQAPQSEILNNPYKNIASFQPQEEVKKENAGSPGYSGPEKAIFEPTSVVGNNQSAATQSAETVKQKPSVFKIILIIFAILAFCAILGLTGYYVIPAIFSNFGTGPV